MSNSRLGEWVFQQGDHAASDVLFVFGTPHHVDAFAARIKALEDELELRAIILSGAGGEAEAIAEAATRHGVRASLHLERHATNTRENVLRSQVLFRSLCRSPHLHVLAKLYAGPRCLLTLRQLAPGWHVRMHHVDWFGVDADDWWRHPGFRGKVVQELRKVVKYGRCGDIARPDRPWTLDLLKKAATDLEGSTHSR